jgi:hypothetical protein
LYHVSAFNQGNIIQPNTGGNALLGTVGLDVYFGRITFGASFQSPMEQRYNSEESVEITGGARWMGSVICNF